MKNINLQPTYLHISIEIYPFLLEEIVWPKLEGCKINFSSLNTSNKCHLKQAASTRCISIAINALGKGDSSVTIG